MASLFDRLTWPLTDGQLFWLLFALILATAIAGWSAARAAWRHNAALRHPAARPPYDWAQDRTYRRAITVRRTGEEAVA